MRISYVRSTHTAFRPYLKLGSFNGKNLKPTTRCEIFKMAKLLHGEVLVVKTLYSKTR